MRLTTAQREACEAVLQKHARTFSLAARFLSEETAEYAAATYAWCRRADDAIDLAPRHAHAEALETLRAELDLVFSDEDAADPVLGGFQTVVRARAMPRLYCDELLLGMNMDAEDVSYETLGDLLVYCYRVAGTVGLMMAHVLGVRDEAALPAAAQLGMAMQLTNICRDVAEDHERGRCYLPSELLGPQAAALIRDSHGTDFPDEAKRDAGRVRGVLLSHADRYYAAADEGLRALDWRSSLAIGVARRGYAAIGTVVRRRGVHRINGRAFVRRTGKLLIALRALGRVTMDVPRRVTSRFRPIVPRIHLEYTDVQLRG
jgi:phytoene synthase